jgi:hypothetical protein
MRDSGSEAAAPNGVALPPGAGYGSSGNAIATPGVALQSNALQLNTRNVANVWGRAECRLLLLWLLLQQQRLPSNHQQVGTGRRMSVHTEALVRHQPATILMEPS